MWSVNERRNHVSSQGSYYKVCADVMVMNKNKIAPHIHPIPTSSKPVSKQESHDSDHAEQLGAPLQTQPLPFPPNRGNLLYHLLRHRLHHSQEKISKRFCKQCRSRRNGSNSSSSYNSSNWRNSINNLFWNRNIFYQTNTLVAL